MTRPTNAQLCAAYRDLLTVGAKVQLSPEVLAATKDWRNDLWKAFREIEDRLCPVEALTRSKQGDND